MPTLKESEVSLSYGQRFLYFMSASKNVSQIIQQCKKKKKSLFFILHGWILSRQPGGMYMGGKFGSVVISMYYRYTPLESKTITNDISFSVVL